MKAFLRIAAGLVSIPALVLTANVTWFAFVGAGFLPEATDAMQGSRAMVMWFSATAATVLMACSA